MTDTIEHLYSEEGLAAVAAPGGYTSPGMRDTATGAPMHLDNLAVPLALADHILWAHSEDQSPACFRTPSWEGTLADLAQDLLIRCEVLEQRLAAHPCTN